MGWVDNATPWSFYPRKRDPVPVVWEAMCAPGPVWTDAENLGHTGGFFSLFVLYRHFFFLIVLASCPCCTTHTKQTSMPQAGFEPAPIFDPRAFKRVASSFTDWDIAINMGTGFSDSTSDLGRWLSSCVSILLSFFVWLCASWPCFEFINCE